MKAKEKKSEDKSSARFQAFRMIEEMLKEPKNKVKLKRAFQEAFDEDPVSFYKQFIKPTAEKELTITPVGTGTPASLKVVFSEESEDEENEIEE